MSDLGFTICCLVTFFSKKRTSRAMFIYGEDVIFDKPIQANALPVYETVDYSAIRAGTEFFIMEGGNIVGEGIVKAIFQHKPYGSK